MKEPSIPLSCNHPGTSHSRPGQRRPGDGEDSALEKQQVTCLSSQCRLALCPPPLSLVVSSSPSLSLCPPLPVSPSVILCCPFLLTLSFSPSSSPDFPSPVSPLRCPLLPVLGDYASPAFTHLAGILPSDATGTHHVVRDSPREHSSAGGTGDDGDVEALQPVREWV